MPNTPDGMVSVRGWLWQAREPGQNGLDKLGDFGKQSGYAREDVAVGCDLI